MTGGLPGRCVVCGAAVEWRAKAWRSSNRVGQWRQHRCPADRLTCGAPMPYAHERCASRPGHGTEHRTAYAMENQRRAKRGAA